MRGKTQEASSVPSVAPYRTAALEEREGVLLPGGRWQGCLTLGRLISALRKKAGGGWGRGGGRKGRKIIWIPEGIKPSVGNWSCVAETVWLRQQEVK